MWRRHWSSPSAVIATVGRSVEPARLLFRGERQRAREGRGVEPELLDPRELAAAHDLAGDRVELPDVLVAQPQDAGRTIDRARQHFGPAEVGEIELRVKRRDRTGRRRPRRRKRESRVRPRSARPQSGGYPMDVARRSLGTSGIEVSRLALGSWRTFERISADDGLAVMRAARDAGITFLDDARYDDETGTRADPHRLLRSAVR